MTIVMRKQICLPRWAQGEAQSARFALLLFQHRHASDKTIRLKHYMEIIGNNMPEDVYSFLMIGAAGLVAVWFAFFIIRKLLTVAVIAVVVIGGLIAWHNPTALRSAQDFAMTAYDQLRYQTTTD
ncbi:hypothetical protein [uncultured Agrobacterium sp.]|uniref:hypothetical protein n=1 Tax=uncultured Agrobacterium sp. TaxID=157277 RepID=UPI0025F34C8F|nr:hypothetical protein [uncultured Agrobacterium sp.]